MAALSPNVAGVESTLSPSAQHCPSFESLDTDVLILIFEEVCDLHLSKFTSCTHRLVLGLQFCPRLLAISKCLQVGGTSVYVPETS